MSARRLILKKMTAKIAFGANLLAEHTLKKIVKKMKLILLFGLSRMKSKEPYIHITSVCSTELFGKWRTVQGQVFSLSLSVFECLPRSSCHVQALTRRVTRRIPPLSGAIRHSTHSPGGGQIKIAPSLLHKHGTACC
jgi:hypothetical protein